MSRTRVIVFERCKQLSLLGCILGLVGVTVLKQLCYIVAKRCLCFLKRVHNAFVACFFVLVLLICRSL